MVLFLHWLWSAYGEPLLRKLGITPALLPPVMYVATPATIPIIRVGLWIVQGSQEANSTLCLYRPKKSPEEELEGDQEDMTDTESLVSIMVVE